MPQKEKNVHLYPIIGLGMGSPAPLYELIQGPKFPPFGALALACGLDSKDERECGRVHDQCPLGQT